MRFSGMRVSSDERISGGGDCVDYLLKDVAQKVKHQFFRTRPPEKGGGIHIKGMHAGRH